MVDIGDHAHAEGYSPGGWRARGFPNHAQIAVEIAEWPTRPWHGLISEGFEFENCQIARIKLLRIRGTGKALRPPNRNQQLVTIRYAQPSGLMMCD